jgi:hypothetical protein
MTLPFLLRRVGMSLDQGDQELVYWRYAGRIRQGRPTTIARDAQKHLFVGRKVGRLSYPRFSGLERLKF